jgi:ABC-type oligopeptide transport system substrate-binding subunit
MPNYSRYSNSDYEQILEKLRVTPIGRERAKLAMKANEILVNRDVIVIPLVLRTQVFAVSKKLQNFKVSPYQVIPLSELRK